MCLVSRRRTPFKKSGVKTGWQSNGDAKQPNPFLRSKLPFGYTDGISTPTIRGGPETYHPDHQQPCEPWLFILQDDARNYTVPEPRKLGLNGSFAVFKKIETDVGGFENFLLSN